MGGIWSKEPRRACVTPPLQTVNECADLMTAYPVFCPANSSLCLERRCMSVFWERWREGGCRWVRGVRIILPGREKGQGCLELGAQEQVQEMCPCPSLLRYD